MRIEQLDDDIAQKHRDEFSRQQRQRTRALLSPTDHYGPAPTVHLGIFDDTGLRGVVTLEARGRQVYEVHLALQRGRGVDDLLPAFFSIKSQLFGELGTKELLGWVPTMHSGIQRLAETVGFKWTGATVLQVNRKRLVEWRLLALRAH